MRKSIVVLYSELADYAVTGLNQLAHFHNVIVVHWPANSEAPFQIRFENGIKAYNRKDFSSKQVHNLLLETNPDTVLVSGWIDKGYIKAINNLPDLKKRVLMMDTGWTGSLKQKLGLLILKPLIRGLFSHAFVSGNKCMIYANKLGLKEYNIYTGFYSASVDQFEPVFKKRKYFPKAIVYVGRYVKHKGIFEMWEAFIELVNEGFSDWKLICAGTGNQWENRMEHPNIEHLGFIQPSEMQPMLLDASIYVLPSHFEPWGVSVHEMAAAGLPMILSKEVGAGEKFLVEGGNGFSFPAKNKDALKDALRKMMLKSPNELALMGKISNELAQSITPKTWIETIIKIVED